MPPKAMSGPRPRVVSRAPMCKVCRQPAPQMRRAQCANKACPSHQSRTIHHVCGDCPQENTCDHCKLPVATVVVVATVAGDATCDDCGLVTTHLSHADLKAHLMHGCHAIKRTCRALGCAFRGSATAIASHVCTGRKPTCSKCGAPACGVHTCKKK